VYSFVYMCMCCHSYGKKLSAKVFYRISTRLLSVSETAIALRPFIFSVHPDLFGKFPKEQVKNDHVILQQCSIRYLLIRLCMILFHFSTVLDMSNLITIVMASH